MLRLLIVLLMATAIAAQTWQPATDLGHVTIRRSCPYCHRCTPEEVESYEGISYPGGWSRTWFVCQCTGKEFIIDPTVYPDCRIPGCGGCYPLKIEWGYTVRVECDTTWGYDTNPVEDLREPRWIVAINCDSAESYDTTGLVKLEGK